MSFLPSHSHVMVIGAGPVGMLAALLLQQQGKQVLLLEARPQQVAVRDRRTLALSFNSAEAFAAAGVHWPATEVTPIADVHISQQHRFGRTLLRAADLGRSHLGITCDYALLLQSAEAALRQQALPVAWSTRVRSVRSTDHYAVVDIEQQGRSTQLTADWVVLAEGGQLAETLPGIRRHSHDYQQAALVATLQFEQPAGPVAYERFADAGPLALLPYHDAYRLVWTRTPAAAHSLRQLETEAFAEAFAASFGDRLGRVCDYRDASCFPLVLKQLNRVYSRRVICIGNAAQTMHPVAAQGLNLGVRDALALVALLAEPHSLADGRLAQRYAAARRLDAHAIVGFTHSLVTLFDHPPRPLQWLRGGVMGGLDAVPAWRQAFTRKLIYGL